MAKTKRPSKADKEAVEREALKRRVLDLAYGAHGGYTFTDPSGEEFPGMVFEMGLESFGRWIGAIRLHLLTEGQNEERRWLFDPTDLKHFDQIDSAVDRLYEAGVRA